MKVVNLTPHAINLKNENTQMTFQPSGSVARVSMSSNLVQQVVIDGVVIPVSQNVMGSVEGLPEPQHDVIYLVSALVGSSVSGRSDVYGPDTSPASVIRDDKGQIVGVSRLQKF